MTHYCSSLQTLAKRLMNNKTILVIEENLALLDNTREFLELHGYSTAIASSCQEGLSVLEKMRPGLILCDMRRPQLDDFSILKHVKSTPEYRAIPFLIFSGHSEKKDIQEAIALGADDYLVMPFEMRDLLKLVRHHMKSAQKEAANKQHKNCFA